MRGEWCYFKSFFSPEQCDKILEIGLSLPAEEAKIGVDGSEDSYRKSKIRFIQKTDPNFTWLFDAMWKLASQSNDEWFSFHVSRITYIQLAEYDESNLGKYDRHHDVFYMNGDPKYHRKLTAVVQLSSPSDYEGGELTLHNISQYPDYNEIKERGTVFFMPAFTEHSVTPVTKGKRYSLACWFEGNKWC